MASGQGRGPEAERAWRALRNVSVKLVHREREKAGGREKHRETETQREPEGRGCQGETPAWQAGH